jgi:uncharacterized protein (TIGR03118 family)
VSRERGVTMEIAACVRGRARWLLGGSVVVAALALTGTVPAVADQGGNVLVRQTNLVANRSGFDALTVDPHLVNAWGLSKLPTSPVWVSDNGTDVTTLYAGGSAAPASATIVSLVVSVPGGPTGQIANTSTSTTSFVLSTGGAARFVFVNEAGEVWGWNPSKGATAQRTAAVPGAVFKGLATGLLNGNPVLYAADFGRGRIDVFDGSWNLVSLPDAFKVPGLPDGFAPFNVQVLHDAQGAAHLYVAYAQREPGSIDEVHGKRLGLVVEFTAGGVPVRRFERPAAVNAPWGLAYAPASWGRLAGMLLVGQFGTGRIEVFDPATGDYEGPARGLDHHPIVIDGLWGLLPGDATAGGVGSLLFTAGPNDEADGLYGVLTPG